MAEKDRKYKKIVEKGQCIECPYYNDCPRMKGINRCYNRHGVKPEESRKAVSPSNKEP